MEIKKCVKCNQDKTIAEFYKNAIKYPVTCKRCVKKISDRKYHSSKDGIIKARKHALKYNYGISIEQYDNILKLQDNRCAICNTHCDDIKQKNPKPDCFVFTVIN